MGNDTPPPVGLAPRPPQSEVTHTGLIESIIIPWRRAINTCGAAALFWAFVYAVWACVWLGKRIETWHVHWWDPWRDMLERIGQVWPWLLIPWLLSCVLVWAASYLGNIVQVLNEKYWPVLMAVDPAEHGLLGILFGRRRKEEPTQTEETEAEAVEQVWPVRIQVDSADGSQRLYATFDVPERYAENWQRFCEAVAKPDGFLTPRFSKAGARRFNIPWEVFAPIQREYLARGLAWQEQSLNGSGRVHLRAIGRAVCRAFAVTPPPGA